MSPRLAIALPNRDPLKTAKKLILARFGMRQDEHELKDETGSFQKRPDLFTSWDRISSRIETGSTTDHRETGSTKGM
jgi:hypothetical protein